MSVDDNYEKMQKETAAGTRFNFHDEESRRIVDLRLDELLKRFTITPDIESKDTRLTRAPAKKRRSSLPSSCRVTKRSLVAIFR